MCANGYNKQRINLHVWEFIKTDNKNTEHLIKEKMVQIGRSCRKFI